LGPSLTFAFNKQENVCVWVATASMIALGVFWQHGSWNVLYCHF